ncbi:hypothetical protein EI555_014154 [Monodon monoceros]|uniref:Cation channel sperm-associated auxiliary subunit delta n=1 Tax=Monodon monoceros TaxID=40151 RepID=A0A4U1F9P3_MONMO|nr:hypothetical protein EI555_014154 [Monodon monoceros]
MPRRWGLVEDHLYFSSGTTRLMKHPCKKNIALYLGRQVFLTKNSFESSVLPFSIPTSMQVGIPEVTSAHFAGSVLLLVVNRKVYVYDYGDNSWNASTGVEHPVSHISGDNCCYSGNSFCMAELVGSLGGIFYFYSLSQVGLLLVDQRKAMFSYSDHPLNHSFGLPFDYNGTLDILIAPGQKGILIFWFEKSLLVSRNAGQLVNPVQVREGQHILYSSISEANITIHSVAANENELAVLTQENNLYYGSLGILSSSLIKFADQNIWSEEAVLMFTDVGMLEILTPLPDPTSPAFDFQKCPVNIQAILMDPQLQVDVCKTALISVGCDLEKKIVIQNEISACYNGILDPVALQDNYSYVIEREAYDPSFRGQKATEDLEVPYHYEKLGCPILVYYDTPWKPVVELWRAGKFQEVVEAEYVLLEVNGLFTYTYSLTADMALCSSQPQNWTTIAKTAGSKGPFAWDRENYVSCHDPNTNAPLRWPKVPYQILGGPTENKVVFDQRNGIYIFFISIVDPYYSYCHLETTFSVYVYGAFPLPIFPPEIAIVLLTGATLLSVWLAYMIPKLLHTEQGLRVKGVGVRLRRRCRKSCACVWARC